MSFLKVFGGFLMKNFDQVMGLLFGSAGAHTYLKSKIPPPPLVKAVFEAMSCMWDLGRLSAFGIHLKCMTI